MVSSQHQQPPPQQKPIIEFYNVLAAQLSLEEIENVDAIFNLLPTVARLIKTGDLSFTSCQKFSFRHAVEMLRQSGASRATLETLNSDAAQKGDVEHALKIYTMFMYEIRLLHKEKFAEICEKLDASTQEILADIISTMDEDFDEQIELRETPTLVTPSRAATPFIARKTPYQSVTRRYRPSPIAEVIFTPRGDEVERVRKLSKENVEMRHRIEEINSHIEGIETENEKLKNANGQLATIIDELTDPAKNPITRPLKKSVSMLEEQICAFRSTELELHEQVRSMQQQLSVARAELMWMGSEKDVALQRSDIFAKERDTLKQGFDTMLGRLEQQSLFIEELRSESLARDSKHSAEVMARDGKIRKLEQTIVDQAHDFKSRLFAMLSEINELKTVAPAAGDRLSLGEEFCQCLAADLRAKNEALFATTEQLRTTIDSSEVRCSALQRQIDELNIENSKIKNDYAMEQLKSVDELCAEVENVAASSPPSPVHASAAANDEAAKKLRKHLAQRDRKIDTLECLLKQEGALIRYFTYWPGHLWKCTPYARWELM